MGDDNKSATAVSKKRAKARIHVVTTEGKPIQGARVEIWSQTEGITDNKGVWTSGVFLEGTYDLKVFADGYSPPDKTPREEWTHISSEDFPAATSKQPFKEVTVQLAQALPRARVFVKDPSRSNTNVPGAEVEITSQTQGRADLDGVYVSSPFLPGKWHVKVRKPGYGPPVSAPPGVEDSVEEWHVFNKPEDTEITIQLASVWGRIKSSKIEVNGKHFVEWFNKDFRPRMPKHVPVVQDKTFAFLSDIPAGQFKLLFDNCEKLWAPEMTLEEFVALFLIIYNETGASLRPLSERPPSNKIDPKYFFEAGTKLSYNGGGNRKAGDQLKAMGLISDDEVAAWNSQKWPNPPEGSPLFNASLECDFYKYRGRGLIQTTFRSAYRATVDPVLKTVRNTTSDQLTEKELGDLILSDPEIYLGMVKVYLNAIKSYFLVVNAYDWKTFGLAVAGQNAKSYSRVFEWRCNMLFTEMRKDGFKLE